jgi:cobalt-zinc-cadmium efflux system outer membrane protein
MKLYAVLGVGLTIAATGIARADDVPAIGMLLADPSRLAQWLRDRDPVFESARHKVEAANELGEQARVHPNPQLTLGAGGFVIGATNAGSGGPTDASPRLTLGQTTNVQVGIGELFEIGKRGPRSSAADLRAREAGQLAVNTLGGRIGEATQNLGKLAFVVARRDVVAANLAAARTLRDLEKVRLDHQDLSALEFARIELDTEELELQLGRSEAEVASAVAACSATLYAPCPASGLDATTLDAAAHLPEPMPIPEAAIEQRPVRQASKLEAQALGWDATLAHNRRIPDPTLGVSYLLDNLVIAGNQHQQLIFTASIPLPLFDRGDHDAAAARANARAIEAEDRGLVREARGVIEALLAQRATLTTTLATLETAAVPKSTQIILQTRRAFDLGQARLADLLLVERAHRDLLLEVLDTRFDLFNVRAQLRQALGLDDEVARATTGTPP